MNRIFKRFMKRVLGATAALALSVGAASQASGATLTLWYPILGDETIGGTVTNLAGTGDGTLIGGGTLVGGAPGASIPGDGLRFTNDNGHYIDTGLGADVLGASGGDGYLMSAWINMTANTGESMVFGQLTTPALHNGVRGAAYHQGHWGNDINTGGGVAFDGANGAENWRHVIWSYANGIQAIVVDGNLLLSAARGPLANNGTVVIGSGSNNGGIDGIIDDVAMYKLGAGENVSLAQINHLAGGGNPSDLPANPNNNDFVAEALAVARAALVEDLKDVPDLGSTRDMMWNIREHYRANDQQPTTGALIANVAQIARDGSMSTINHRVPVINFADTGEGFFAPSNPFASDNLTVQGQINGDDNDFGIQYKGHIRIDEAGEYTFGFRGDDGSSLTIKGQNFTSSSGFGWHSGDTLAFSDPTGNSSTFGVVTLQPGVYEVSGIWAEGGGGANFEVFAAQGAHTEFGDDFRPIGHKKGPDTLRAKAGIDGQWAVFTSAPGADGAIDSVATAEAAIAGSGQNSVTAADAINFNDPQSGGPGRIGGDTPFATDTGADDNDFAAFAVGNLLIPADGTYLFGFQGDDGGYLRILGETFTSLVENATGLAVIDEGGQRILCDCLTGNSSTVGEIFLTAGTYQIETLFFERGGGAYWEVFTSGPDTPQMLLMNGGASAEIIVDFDGIQLVGIPEPTTMALVGLGGMAMMRRRRNA